MLYRDIDILVNATSIGLYPDVDAKPDVDLSQAGPKMLVCDVVFNPPETPLLAMAKSRDYPCSMDFRCWCIKELSALNCGRVPRPRKLL